jgi:GNAT superfamily N-acetyltransferase
MAESARSRDGQVNHRMFVDFRRNEAGYRDVYLALANVIRARETWDRETLDFVFEKLAWLQSFAHPQELSSEQAQQAYDEVIRVRRREVPDPSQVLAVMRSDPGEPKRVYLGPYHMKLAVRAPGVLEIRNLETDLKEDWGENFETLRHLAELARREGFASLELADWRNIHEGRVFERSGEYITVMKPVPAGNRSIDTPTYIQDLTRPKLPEGWDLSMLARYLDENVSRAVFRVGPFEISMRKQELFTAGNKRAVTITNIDADHPGTGQYPLLLQTLAYEAKRRGYQALMVEGTDDPRHHRFYERMGFERVPRTDEHHRSYYTDL